MANFTPNMPSKEYWIARAEERMTAHFDNAENVGKQLKKEYEKALREIQKEISYFYAKYSKDNQISYADAVKKLSSNSRITRLDHMMNSIKKEIDSLANFEQLTIQDFLAKTLEENYYQTIYEIQKGIGVGASFSLINKKAIEEILSYPWSGEMFAERIWSSRDRLIRVLRQELTQGFIQGRSVQNMARGIADKMDNSYKNSLRLARTETTYVANASTYKAYEESGVVEKYEYLATLDSRTSDVCQSLDGKVFNLSEKQEGVNFPPLHPNCRSTTIASFGDKTGERIARGMDGKTYYVPSNMSYQSWKDKYL